MTVEELLVYGKQYIHSDLAKILLAELLNKSTLELFNYLNEVIEEDKINKYKEEVKYIQEGKPIQYVIGNVNFYGNRFKINENVLIPRFETEELVENTIKYINNYFDYPIDIIDLGCGSGVIGLTLEQKVNVNKLDLVDISPKALEIAKINKETLKSKATLIQSDMWENVCGKYDVIISNPPYIKTTEEIETIVKDNEPHLALYAGEDGLDCYKKIINDIIPHMKDKCIIAFEIGMTQKEDISNLFKEKLEKIDIKVLKDLSGKDRMLFVFKNIE